MVVGDFIVDDGFEDGCSICLDPFTTLHPASVTKCKHEYHLHCIVEWSRRRSQCPVCLQHLVLNDPAGQEMVAAAAREKESKTKRSNEHPPRARGSNRERLMRRRAAAAAAAMHARRIRIARRMRPPTTLDPFHCFPTIDLSKHVATLENVRSRSNEFVAFSESLKSKLSTASARYRESLSKGTQRLKEKIMARNDSVKELSKGVQREMSAGIAGLAKLIARKRGGV